MMLRLSSLSMTSCLTNKKLTQLSRLCARLLNYQPHDFVGLIFFCDFRVRDFRDFQTLALKSSQIRPHKKRPVFDPKIAQLGFSGKSVAPPGLRPWYYNRPAMPPGGRIMARIRFIYRYRVFICQNKKRRIWARMTSYNDSTKITGPL